MESRLRQPTDYFASRGACFVLAEFHFGELLPRVGFIVTDLAADNRAVVRFYNKPGTAEQWMRRPSGPFSSMDASRCGRSWVGGITITSGFDFR
ncbi:MAG: hypothetical protein WA005_00195 [Candidatus Binataceae bacterium]